MLDMHYWLIQGDSYSVKERKVVGAWLARVRQTWGWWVSNSRQVRTYSSANES
jgi:hypothetical protein